MSRSNLSVLFGVGAVAAVIGVVLLVRIFEVQNIRAEKENEQRAKQAEEDRYLRGLIENPLLSREELIAGALKLAHAERFDGAAAVLERAASLKPPSAELWVEVAEMKQRAGLYGDAEVALARAAALGGRGASVIARAHTLAAKGQRDDAIDALREEAKQSGDKDVRGLLGWLLVERGTYSQAEQILAEHGEHPELDAARGFLHLEQGRIEAALVAAKGVVEKKPDGASGQLLLGLVRLKLAQPGEAIRALALAAALQPTDHRPLIALCDAYWAAKNYGGMDQTRAALARSFPGETRLTKRCEYSVFDDGDGTKRYVRANH